MKKKLAGVFALSAVCLLGGMSSSCALMRDKREVNTSVINEPDLLLERRDILQKGMTREAVFETLGIVEIDTLKRMAPDEITKEIYSGVLLQAPFEKRDEVEAYFASFSGYWVRHEDIDVDKKYGLSGTRTETTGRVVLFPVIFKDDVLYKVGLDTGSRVKEKEKKVTSASWGPAAFSPSSSPDFFLSRVAHFQELLAAAGFQRMPLHAGQFIQRFFNVVADDVDRSLRLPVRAAHGLLDDRIDDAKLF